MLYSYLQQWNHYKHSFNTAKNGTGNKKSDTKLDQQASERRILINIGDTKSKLYPHEEHPHIGKSVAC